MNKKILFVLLKIKNMREVVQLGFNFFLIIHNKNNFEGMKNQINFNSNSCNISMDENDDCDCFSSSQCSTTSSSTLSERNRLSKKNETSEEYLDLFNHSNPIIKHFSVKKGTKVGDNQIGVKCKYCNWKATTNVTRMKQHIYCVPGNVLICPKSPVITREGSKSKEEIIENEVKASKTSKTIPEWVLQENSKKINISLLRMICSTGIAFSVIDNYFFQDFVKNVSLYGAEYNLPNRKEIPIMLTENKNKLDSQSYADKVWNDVIQIIQSSSKIRGSNLLYDTFTNVNGHQITAFHLQSGNKRFFVKSYVSTLNIMNSSYYESIIEETIKYLEDNGISESEIFSIISDGAPVVIKASNEIAKIHNMFPIRCITHALNIIASNLCKNSFFVNLINDMKCISKFFRSFSYIRSHWEHQNGKKIPLLSRTRFLSVFYLIDNIQNQLSNIKSFMVQEFVEEWIEKQEIKIKDKYLKVCEILNKKNFRDRIQFSKKYLLPVVLGLRLIDCQQPVIGYISHLFRLLSSQLTEVILQHGEAIPEIKQFGDEPDIIITEAFNKLDRNVFAVAELLNPFSHALAVNQWLENDKSIRERFEDVVNIFLKKNIIKPEPELFEIKRELNDYINKKDKWMQKLSNIDKLEEKISPATWWEIEGSGNLARIAIHILSISPTQSFAESVFSTWTSTQNKKRNRLRDQVSSAVIKTGLSLNELRRSGLLPEVANKRQSLLSNDEFNPGFMWKNNIKEAKELTKQQWIQIVNWVEESESEACNCHNDTSADTSDNSDSESSASEDIGYSSSKRICNETE